MAPTQSQFQIGGMSCSFCAETIKKAYRRTEGVESVNVSLAHEEVLVQFDDEQVSEVDLKDTLRNLGYTIRDPDKTKRFEEQQAELEQARRRLWLGGIASVITAGLMLRMIFVVSTFESRSLVMDYVVLGLALATMFGAGFYIKEKAYQSLRRGIFNQHVLLEAGAFAGLLGGLLGLTRVPGLDVASLTGGAFALPVFTDVPTVHFFAVSVFVTTYHILSEYTSLIVRTRASRSVQGLLDLQPDTARRVLDDGAVEEVEVVELQVGDRVRVQPGETIPIDGEVIEGGGAVDESVATGESAPIDKRSGDHVIGGSVNRTGTLLVEVSATGEDAFLNRVAQQIEEARAMKPGIVQLADRVLEYFVPGVLTIAVGSLAFWLVVPAVVPGTFLGSGPQLQTGAFAALAVLVLGYPCALGMATPLALIRGGGEAAEQGILMRSGDAFQIFKDIDTVVLDKTGTISRGEPAVGEVVALGPYAETDVCRLAASAEVFSEHPLAEAILDHADERGVGFPDPEAFDSVTGKGVRATVDGDDVLVGKPGWIDAADIDLSAVVDDLEQLQGVGLTAVGVVVNGELIGLVGIGDDVKADAKATIDRMKAAGIAPVMLTGDNERTAESVARAVGIERVMANVLPDDKREEVGRLQEEAHRVAMVGDGINDAPALTQADIGIAIGAGTDIAIESADIVLMGDRLGGVMDAYEIGKVSYRKTKQNLIGAFSFNGIGVAAATTGLVHPVFAMLAMILSVSAILANSFAGQLLSGGGVTLDFTVDAEELDEGAAPVAAEPEPTAETGTEEADPSAAPADGSPAEALAADPTKPARETVTFRADLHCGGCEQRVVETLGECEGVREVDADADAERVAIVFNPRVTSADDLRAVISDQGYTVEAVEAPAPAD